MEHSQDRFCPPESLLIRLAAGELDDEKRAELERHLNQCAACRDQLAAIRQVDVLLGQWDPAVPQRDLADAVVARALTRTSAATWVLRVAASLLLCGTVGFAVGRLSAPATPATPAPTPDDDAVALALGLDALAEQADLLGTVDFTGRSEVSP